MKQVTVIVRQPDIGRIFPNGFRLMLEDNTSLVDALRIVDEEIKKTCDTFPAKKYKSLMHMVYHPYENRFYKQVAIQANTSSQQFLNVRDNPRMPLPNETTVILIPHGGCITDWEEPVEQQT